ncbi:MAG: carotenoid oxygenase family protein [Thermoflexibacter sp.]|nr:carotenoid oxygenase family protein [Thermoflexibacter sp.]
MNRPVMYASNKELDVELEVVEGKIPTDIYGHVFVNSPCGSVNSNGLPFPATNKDGSPNREYASPIMNGDAYVFRFDFDETNKVKLKTRLLKTPCYYADLATQKDKPKADPHTYKNFFFRNMGISRISLALGARNELNTAVVPFQFSSDKASRMVATYDVGRPYEIDPVSLEVITPIGKNTEWLPATPPLLNFPFPLVQSTAHPVFDPVNKIFYTVNFTKSTQTMLSSMELFEMMLVDEKEVENRLEGLLKEVEKGEKKTSLAKLNNFLKNIKLEIQGKPTWWKKILNWILGEVEEYIEAKSKTYDSVYVMAWNGEQGKLDKWEVLDNEGKAITIKQCIHQISLTKDYLILIDSSFKFSIDILVNNPFPNNQTIDRIIRQLISGEMEPFTDVYLVKRADLQEGVTKVNAKKLVKPIPLECVHFTAEYENPNGIITLHTAHNSAACLAEWLRPFDISALNGQPIDKDYMGIFALGDMDIGRIGKFEINAEKAEIVKESIFCEMGNTNTPNQIGANSWGVGLHTFRNIISPEIPTSNIKHIFWQTYGLNRDMLSQFIYGLYKDYPNRKVPLPQLIALTQQQIPYTLLHIDTTTMQAKQVYVFPNNYNLRSIQFIPKKGEAPTGIDAGLHGYIFCTMLIGEGQAPNTNYFNQIWIFDAQDLSRPICKLAHQDMQFTFTLHCTWIPSLLPSESKYNVPVQEDYNELINTIIRPKRKKLVRRFFDDYVYPNF